MRWKLFALALLLIVSVSLASAKGVAPKIVITGNEIQDELVITLPMINEYLTTARLEIFTLEKTVPPDNLGEPYVLDRGFDIVEYYPDPEGGAGYVYYVGLVNGFSEYDRRWFRTRFEGDFVMRFLLSMYDTFNFAELTADEES